MRKSWTEEEMATVRRMALEGATHRQMAEALGRSVPSVQAWCFTHAVWNGRAMAWTTREHTRAVAMYTQGLNCREIGEALGRTAQSVNARLHEFGVTSRARSGWRRTAMHGMRYALARKGYSTSEIIAILGLKCKGVSFRAWLVKYAERAGLPKPVFKRGPQRFRPELVAEMRRELGLTAGEQAR
jgi:transposase